MSKTVAPSIIATDRATLRAIEGLADYQSVNPACSITALQESDAALQAAQDAAEQARLTFERARQAYMHARIVEAEKAQHLHNIVRVAKSQVLAQYGADSYAVKAIGWVRSSERKRPVRRPSAD